MSITNSTRLIDLTVGQLQEILNENIDSRIANSQPTQSKEDDELLTVKEAAAFLKISKMSLHNWKKAGKVKYHRIGSRIRFKKSELLNAGTIKNSRK